MPKPLHTPDYQIKKSIFTPGSEYATRSTEDGSLIEYIGFYHTYPNGTVYSGANYDRSSSVPLLRLPGIGPNGGRYYEITSADYSNHVAPTYHIPTPNSDDYKRGTMSRYIVQQRNVLTNITEISQAQFERVNISNNIGIDGNRYKSLIIKWTITGSEPTIIKANQTALIAAEYEIPGIRYYLSDLTEFSKK